MIFWPTLSAQNEKHAIGHVILKRVQKLISNIDEFLLLPTQNENDNRQTSSITSSSSSSLQSPSNNNSNSSINTIQLPQ